jgi:hypothetical protein
LGKFVEPNHLGYATIPLVLVSPTTDWSVQLALEANGNYGVGGVPNGIFAGYRSRGTFEAPEPVDIGDSLVSYNGYGYDGSDWYAGARMRFIASTAWSGGSDRYTRIEFDAVPSGGSTREVVATIDSLGVNIPAGAQYMINGIAISGGSSASSIEPLQRIMLGIP